MKVSLQTRITVAFLLLQTILFFIGLSASDHSYVLWVFGGAGVAFSVLIGAIAGPILFISGLVRKAPANRRCGLALIIFNTIPFVLLIAVSIAAGL